MSAREPRRSTLRLAGLGTVIVAFWWMRIVVPGTTPALSTIDLRLFFYPAYHALFARVAQGELPLWNPYQLCGEPWLGSPQGGLFYPPHLLHLLLPTDSALLVLGVLHLLLVALSTVAFARRAGLGPTAGAVAALLLTTHGTMVLWFVAPPLLESAAWLPLGGVAVLGLARRPGAGPVAGLALVLAASWLAGGPQPTVYLLYAWSALVPAALIATRAPPARWVRVALLFTLAIALGTLTAGIQLGPSLEMATEGTRGTARLPADAIFPFGRPTISPTTFLSDQFVGTGDRFGLLGIALLPALLFVRRHRALACWALGIGGAASIISFGPTTPLFEAYYLLPALAWFRNPAQLLFLTDVGLAIAAAIAVDAVWDHPTTAFASPRAGTIARLAMGAAAAMIVVTRAHAHPAAAAVAGGLVPIVALAAWAPRPAAVALVALTVLDLAVIPIGTGLLPYGRTAAEYDAEREVYAQLAALQRSGRVWIADTLASSVPFAPKLASYHHVRSLDDYESITTRRQSEYFTWLLERHTTPERANLIFAGRLTSGLATNDTDKLPDQRRLLDIASVRLVLGVQPDLPVLRDLVAGGDFRPLPAPRPGLVLFENSRALPRAYVVYHVETAPQPELLLERMGQAAFDPLATTYVEGPPLGVGPGARYGHPATIVRDDPEVVEIEATADGEGLLVLADSFYPGWRATVDGTLATILPANHLFRGVALTPGAHRVRFEYRPASVAIGAAASATGAIVIAILLVASARRRRRPGP